MKDHTKKMIAPIIIAAILVMYYVVFTIVFFVIDDIPLVVTLVFGIVPLLFAGVSIYVLIERIREIRSGEEDDLSKY